HIAMLPPDLINGIGGNREFTEQENKIGMRQLAYSSTQGAELLFPNHFPTEYRGRRIKGRLEDISHTVINNKAVGGNLIGTFAAAWDDAGLHEETFHLGWATVTQYGWTPHAPTVEQSVADFMDLFYGAGGAQMVPVYKLAMEGARFFESGWDEVVSTERDSGYGNSYGKGIGTKRTDEVLSLPTIPKAQTLEITPEFSKQYSELIADAGVMIDKNDELLQKLNLAFSEVQRNRYNLEVILSIAYLERYFIQTVLTLNEAEKLMLRAQEAASEGRHANA